MKVRVVLPPHLRDLARIGSEVTLDVSGPVTQATVLDALEARFPMLEGTIRDHVTHRRRAFVRFFACGEDLSHVRPATKREIGRAFVIAIPAIALPFVIRAAVVQGVATATEVSTIGIVYSIAAGLLIYRQFPWRRLYPMLVETAALSGAILLIIGAATGLAEVGQGLLVHWEEADGRAIFRGHVGDGGAIGQGH